LNDVDAAFDASLYVSIVDFNAVTRATAILLQVIQQGAITTAQV
jgi:hypothetical protein